MNNEYTATRRAPRKNPKSRFLMEKQSFGNKARWRFICNPLSLVCASASALIFSRVEASVNIVLIFHRRPCFQKYNNVKMCRVSSRRRPGGGNAVTAGMTNVCCVIFLLFGEQSGTAAAACWNRTNRNIISAFNFNFSAITTEASSTHQALN